MEAVLAFFLPIILAVGIAEGLLVNSGEKTLEYHEYHRHRQGMSIPDYVQHLNFDQGLEISPAKYRDYLKRGDVPVQRRFKHHLPYIIAWVWIFVYAGWLYQG